MAARKPIVLNNGQYEQLQAGDTLDGVSGGGGDIRAIETFSYAASNTFTLATIPAKIYQVLVYNTASLLSYPVADYSWTPGSNSITVSDALITNDKIIVDYATSSTPTGDIVQSLLTPGVNETIAAGYSAYVSDFYEIADQKYLEIGDGAVFEIG